MIERSCPVRRFIATALRGTRGEVNNNSPSPSGEGLGWGSHGQRSLRDILHPNPSSEEAITYLTNPR